MQDYQSLSHSTATIDESYWIKL